MWVPVFPTSYNAKTMMMDETVRQVMSRMQHRQLAGAFDCYAGPVEMLVELWQTLARMMAKVCKWVVHQMWRHQLLMAWNLFVDTVRETQHSRETVRMAMSRTQHSQLAGAFHCYAEAVEMLVA